MKRRKGALALFTVSAMMLVLGIVAYAFHSMGMDTRREVNAAFQGERALALAQSAVDEAFDELQKRVNASPDGGAPKDRELARKIRTAKTSDVIDLSIDPELTRKTADLSFEVGPVEMTLQRFREGADQADTMDARKMPADLKERIKKGWEEFYKTGYCGPDMDLIYSGGSAAGFVAAKTKVTASSGKSAVVRELEVRRVFSHMTHSVTHADDLLAQLGVYPPTADGANALGIKPVIPAGGPAPSAAPPLPPSKGAPPPSAAPSPAPGASPAPSPGSDPSPAPSPAPGTGSGEGDVTMDDIHVAPYDDVRCIRRSTEESF